MSLRCGPDKTEARREVFESRHEASVERKPETTVLCGQGGRKKLGGEGLRGRRIGQARKGRETGSWQRSPSPIEQRLYGA